MRSQRAERAQQPGAEQTSAHCRDRAVDFLEQRALRPAVAAGDHLEVLEGDRIDDQAIGARAIADGADVHEVGFLRVAQMRDEAAGCLDRGGPAPRPKPSRPCVFS